MTDDDLRAHLSDAFDHSRTMAETIDALVPMVRALMAEEYGRGRAGRGVGR
jgi:hypothetical protein